MGTSEVDGKCVVTADPVTCATGTSLVGTECVPDGTVICETGTTFNATTGKCDPDIAGCAAGTVKVGDECVPVDDTLVADVQEPPEPNDPGSGGEGSITAPAVGASTTIKGCISPTADEDMNGNLDPDIDTYVFSVSGPTVLDITVDGLGGMAGGFQVVPLEDALFDAGWFRYGLTMVADTAQRKLYLPGAGSYALLVGDSRSFLTGEGAGNADTCYFATIAAEAIPAATPITAGTPITGTALGDLHVYSYDAGEGAILFNTLVAESEAAAAGMVVMVNGQFKTASEFSDLGADASTFVGGLADADTVTIVTDKVLDYGLSDIPFSLEVSDPGVKAAPADGTAVSVNTDAFNYRWLYFDVAAGEVLSMDVNTNGGDSVLVAILDSNLNPVTTACSGTLDTGGCDQWDGWVQFTTAGRYYVRLFNNTPPPANCGDGTNDADEQCDDGNTEDGDGCSRQCNTEPYTFDVHVTRGSVTPGTLTVGTPATGQTLTGDEYGFHELSVAGSDWLRFKSTPTAFTGAQELTFYDRTRAGVLDDDIAPAMTISLADATDEAGRILVGNDGSYLIRVSDAGGAGAGKSYDLDVADRVFTDIGAVTDTTPATITGATLAADETKYYLARAATGYRLGVTVTGGTGIDPVLTHIDGEEADIASYDENTGAATAETFSSRVGSGGWVAFVVQDVAGTAGMFDGGVTGTPPVSYTSAAAALTYADVCGMGAAHDLDDGDEGLSLTPITLPITFSFYGQSETSWIVSSNGWASTNTTTLDPAWNNRNLPSALAPVGLIAPFWTDLENTTVCTYHDTTNNTFTIQWNGNLYFDTPTVEMQAVLHQDGSIDFVYGTNHTATGSPASTIGVQDQFADSGTEMSYDAAFVTPGDSHTLTPM